MPDRSGSANDSQRVLASLCIVIAMLIGLLVPSIAEAFFPYIFHFLFLMVVFTFCALNANILDIVGNVDNNTWLALVWQMAGIPALTALICFLLNTDLLTTSVLIWTTTAGSVFASPAIANMAGLDRGRSIRTMLLSTLAMPVSLLFFGELTGVLPSDISLSNYVNHVVFFLLLPIVVAIAYWEAQPRLQRAMGPLVDRAMNGMATLALMGFCIGVMHKIHGTGPEHHNRLFEYLLLIMIVVVSAYVVTGLIFSHLGRRSALTIGMLSANRNVALSFALLSDILPAEALKFVAVAQFPIFLAPIIVHVSRIIEMPAWFAQLFRRSEKDTASDSLDRQLGQGEPVQNGANAP